MAQSVAAIALQPVDEVSLASGELAQQLEAQASSVAPPSDRAVAESAEALLPVKEVSRASIPSDHLTITPETLKKFRRGYGEDAAQAAYQIKQMVITSAEGILRKARLVLDMKLRLNRKEWGVWLKEVLGWFGNEATQYLQIAKAFKDFEPGVFRELEPFTILKLRTKRYAPVVARLREELSITSQLIQNFIKEFVTKQPRKKLDSPISGWKQSRSGGGRFYRVELHDEKTGMSIELQAQAEGVLPYQIIASAVALRAEYKSGSVQPNEYPTAEEQQAMVEHDPVVTLQAAITSELNGSFSELACLLEDAPEDALQGQAVEIACDFSQKFGKSSGGEVLQGQAVEIACPIPQPQNITTNISSLSVPTIGWGTPAKFAITLKSGQLVEVKFVPGCEGPITMHQFDFTGPVSPTGFKSHFAVAVECESDYQTPSDYAQFCAEFLASQYQPESAVVKPSPTDTQENPSLVSELEPLEKAFELVILSPSVGYMQRIDDGQIVCCYVGGNNKQTLKQWGEFLTITHTVGTKFQVREAKRLTKWKWELKLLGLSLQQIKKLSTCNVSNDPRRAFPDAPVRKPERVPTDIELDGYQPGDTVRSVTVRNWNYRILEVRKDSLLECQRINTDGVIKATLHPGSVELVSKEDAASQSPEI